MNVVSEIDLLSGVKRTSRQNENSKSPEISRAEHEIFFVHPVCGSPH